MDVFNQIVKRLPYLTSVIASNIVLALAGSRILHAFLFWREKRLLRNIHIPERILVVSDVNIGDAVNIQNCVEVFHRSFPRCRIDYMYNQTADPLIRANPAISRAFPIFRGSIRPTPEDYERIRDILSQGGYDFVVSFCPFLSKKDLSPAGGPAISPIRLIANILKAKAGGRENASLIFHIRRYTGELVRILTKNRPPPVNRRDREIGTRIYLSREAAEKRDLYLARMGISPDHLIVFFNPDTASPYTFIEINIQLALLTYLLHRDCVDRVLLGSGFNYRNIEKKLNSRLPGPLRNKVIIIPRDLPIDVFTALLDASTVLVTGDTGPMHIAASRRICADPEYSFRNRTALVSVFGATDSSIYGYDSRRPTHLDSNQDAPARVFESSCGQKNISCTIQKVVQTCKKDTCIGERQIPEIVEYIAEYLREHRIQIRDERIRRLGY